MNRIYRAANSHFFSSLNADLVFENFSRSDIVIKDAPEKALDYKTTLLDKTNKTLASVKNRGKFIGTVRHAPLSIMVMGSYSAGRICVLASPSLAASIPLVAPLTPSTYVVS